VQRGISGAYRATKWKELGNQGFGIENMEGESKNSSGWNTGANRNGRLEAVVMPLS